MLEGTLEGFTLPDIFQLLAFTKKTGCLRLQDGGAEGQVYFRDGQIYYAVSSSGRLALGRRLVGAGLVDAAQLRRALDDQREARREGRGLLVGQILVDQGAVSQDTLETFVREQVQDAVFDLMRWADGSFTFSIGVEAGGEQPIELSASVENLIMEASRRIEEWDAVKRKLPSLDAVVAMAPVPGDAGEVTLEPEEWRLLTLVDGRRSVGELVEVSGQGEFHTCKVLYGLAGAGLLEIREPGSDGPSSLATLLSQQELLRELEQPHETTVPDAADVPDAPREATVTADLPRAPTPGSNGLRAKVSDGPPGRRPGSGSEPDRSPGPSEPSPASRLSTDPSIDEDLVRRLIDGVKGL